MESLPNTSITDLIPTPEEDAEAVIMSWGSVRMDRVSRKKEDIYPTNYVAVRLNQRSNDPKKYSIVLHLSPVRANTSSYY